jgi:hypothetical protein
MQTAYRAQVVPLAACQPRLCQAGIAGLIVAAAALLAYLPFVALPFISDSYLQVFLGRKYGPVSQWVELAEDVLYRSRATSLVITISGADLIHLFIDSRTFYITSRTHFSLPRLDPGNESGGKFQSRQRSLLLSAKYIRKLSSGSRHYRNCLSSFSR